MSAVQELESLRARLARCPRLERRSLGRWLTRVARNARAGRPVDRSLARLHRAVEDGERLQDARSAPLEHPLAYPPELPVSAHAAALREASGASAWPSPRCRRGAGGCSSRRGDTRV